MRALLPPLDALNAAWNGDGTPRFTAWSAGPRSGDTAAGERSAQNQRLPTVRQPGRILYAVGGQAVRRSGGVACAGGAAKAVSDQVLHKIGVLRMTSKRKQLLNK